MKEAFEGLQVLTMKSPFISQMWEEPAKAGLQLVMKKLTISNTAKLAGEQLSGLAWRKAAATFGQVMAK